jgi:hypothetical protein
VKITRNGKDYFMPVLGDVHEDKDIFGSHAKEHWHMDYRFMRLDIYGKHISKKPSTWDKREAAGKPIWDRSKQNEKVKYNTNTADNEIFYKRLKCVKNHYHLDWEYSENCSYFSNFHEIVELQTLRAAYCGKELILKEGEYFCPHRGTKVDVTNVNEKGEIHCPAHLLKFDKDSLKSII